MSALLYLSSLSSSSNKKRDTGDLLPLIVATGKKQTYPNGFELLWGIHHKGGKKPAYKKFRAINPDPDLLDVMIISLQNFKKSEQWQRGFSQHLSTWLNEDGWENDPPESQSNNGMAWDQVLKEVRPSNTTDNYEKIPGTELWRVK